MVVAQRPGFVGREASKTLDQSKPGKDGRQVEGGISQKYLTERLEEKQKLVPVASSSSPKSG